MDKGITRNTTLLVTVRPGVTTSTLPVVVPSGTVVVIKEAEFTLNVAGVLLNVTLIAPVRFVPRTMMDLPTLPELGTVSTNAGRPTERLKTVPDVSPFEVVP